MYVLENHAVIIPTHLYCITQAQSALKGKLPFTINYCGSLQGLYRQDSTEEAEAETEGVNIIMNSIQGI